MLRAAWLAAGASAAAIVPLSMAFIGDHVPYERRQTALSKKLSEDLRNGARPQPAWAFGPAGLRGGPLEGQFSGGRKGALRSPAAGSVTLS